MRPRLDSAIVRPRWPRAASETQVSTMLRPVPRMSTAASGSIAVSASAPGRIATSLPMTACSSWPTASTATWPIRLVPLASRTSTPARRRGDGDAFLRHRMQSPVRTLRLAQAAEYAREIVGIDMARHVDLARILLRRQPLPVEPAPEMLGIVGIGAHAERADIENVFVEGRRIGDALAEGRALLDQRHADVGVGIAEQMRGKQHPARASSHDDDRQPAPDLSVIQRRSPDTQRRAAYRVRTGPTNASAG